MQYEIKDCPSIEEMKALIPELLEHELLEIKCLCKPHSPSRIMEFLLSDENRKGFYVDGKLYAVFGVDLVGDVGSPYMLNKNLVGHLNFLKSVANYYQDFFTRLHNVKILRNYIHANNKKSLKFLKHFGFSFSEEVTYIENEPFLIFYKEV